MHLSQVRGEPAEEARPIGQEGLFWWPWVAESRLIPTESWVSMVDRKEEKVL